MRVLVACEYSGTVQDAFAARGHDAFSCDFLPSETPGMHLQGDVRDYINDGWDLMIAHPPCTYLTYAGMSKWNAPGRQELREGAMGLFMDLWNAPIPRIAIENPRGYPCKVLCKPHQEVNPFDFGEPVRKRICLWLKGLPPLFSTLKVDVKPTGSCIKSNGRKYNYYYHQGKNSHERSRFFKSVAGAMAQQWGSLLPIGHPFQEQYDQIAKRNAERIGT